MLNLLALLATLGWIVVVAVILALFGRTTGGAWSIAGTVARGVRDWSASRRPPVRRTSSPRAEVEDIL